MSGCTVDVEDDEDDSDVKGEVAVVVDVKLGVVSLVVVEALIAVVVVGDLVEVDDLVEGGLE